MRDFGRTTLLAEYAFVLRPGGIIYTVTDVKGASITFLRHTQFSPSLPLAPMTDPP